MLSWTRCYITQGGTHNRWKTKKILASMQKEASEFMESLKKRICNLCGGCPGRKVCPGSNCFSSREPLIVLICTQSDAIEAACERVDVNEWWVPSVFVPSIVLGVLYFGVRKSGRVKQNLKFIAMYQLIEPRGKLRKRESHINKQHKIILLE